MKAYTRELKEKANRDALYTMIEAVGYDNFLYCDTDSVFYLETPENKKRMEEYTEYCRGSATTTKAQRRICEMMLQKIEQGV